MKNHLTLADRAYIQYKLARRGCNKWQIRRAIEYAEQSTTFRINCDTVLILAWAVE